MSKRLPTMPEDYSGPITYPPEYHGAPCMGGYLITPWDWASMMLSSDLGRQYDLRYDEDPPRAAHQPFLDYFHGCRETARRATEPTLAQRVAMLEAQVATLLAERAEVPPC